MSTPSLKLNALSNWASLAVNVLIGLLLTPFIIRSLGKTGYGVWTLVCSFVGYYGMLDLGVRSAVTRYIARYSVQRDGKALNEVANTALVMFCSVGSLALVFSFLLAGPLADFFKIDPAHRTDFVRLVWILGVTTCISFPSGVFSAIVTAREHFVAKNVVVVLEESMRAVLTVLFVTAGWGLVGVGMAPLTAAVAGAVCNLVLFRRYAGDIRVRLRYAEKKTLGMLLTYGGVTTVIVIADILRINLDSFVIGRWVGVEAVGVYGVAALVIRYMARVITSGMGVLNPRFASLEGRGDTERLQTLLLRSLRVAGILSLGMSFLAATFGPRFIVIWAGEEYAGAVPVLIILSTSYAFALAQNPGIALMYAVNKHHYYAFYTILEAIANVVLSILLATRYGIIGVALGTAIPLLAVKCLVMPIYVSKIGGVTLSQYLKAFYLPVLVISLFVLASYALDLKTLLVHCPLIEYVLIFVAFGVAYLTASFLSLSHFKPKARPHIGS